MCQMFNDTDYIGITFIMVNASSNTILIMFRSREGVMNRNIHTFDLT